jgi:hypothetical protein
VKKEPLIHCTGRKKAIWRFADCFHGDTACDWHLPGEPLADLVHAHDSVECFLDEIEEIHGSFLRAQLERAERGFREGRFTTWDEVKQRNGL